MAWKPSNTREASRRLLRGEGKEGWPLGGRCPPLLEKVFKSIGWVKQNKAKRHEGQHGQTYDLQRRDLQLSLQSEFLRTEGCLLGAPW